MKGCSKLFFNQLPAAAAAAGVALALVGELVLFSIGTKLVYEISSVLFARRNK
jgi:hypothetical protein